MGTAFESAPRAEGPTVSVVVVSYNTPGALEKCLASLCRQPASEILVIDCSDRDPGAALAVKFPRVAFRHSCEKRSIPEMRREGIQASSGEIVALTESWMEPCPGWVESLGAAHRNEPAAAVVGGPIGFPAGGPTASRLEWADYFSEYGACVPRHGDVREVLTVDEISGANVSYKRWALEVCHDLIDDAAWEPQIHGRLRERGHELRSAAAALVRYRRPAPLGQLLRQRFYYGRGHGAARGQGKPWVERLARGVAAPLVSWVLLARLSRRLPRTPGLRARFLQAAPWILVLLGAWALGEAAGSWFGTAREDPAIV